jgi:predicted kinase
MNRNWGDLVYCLATLAPLPSGLLAQELPAALMDLVDNWPDKFSAEQYTREVVSQQQLLLTQAQQYLASIPLKLATKQSIYLAALLYPIVYSLEKQQFSYHKWQHQLATARLILYLLGVPFKLRQQTLLLLLRYSLSYRLVRRYAQLKNIGPSEILEKQYLRLAIEVSPAAVYHFSYLLTMLPNCPYRSQQTALTQFQQQAKCYQLWDGATMAVFGSALVEQLTPLPVKEQQRIYHWLIKLRLQGQIGQNQDAAAYLAAHPQLLAAKTAHLYLAVGIPGAGKSTWFSQNLPQVLVVSSDRKRQELFGDETFQGNNPKVFQECYRDLANCLNTGQSVAFDATNVRIKRRGNFLRLAQHYYAHSTIVYFDLPVDLALQQNQQRSRRVAPPVIRQYFYELEEPRPAEAVHLNLVSTQQTDPHWAALNPQQQIAFTEGG